MSNPNWNKDSNAGRNSKGGVKGNWSDRGTISIPNASPKEKEKLFLLLKVLLQVLRKEWEKLLKVESIVGLDQKILNGRIDGLR